MDKNFVEYQFIIHFQHVLLEIYYPVINFMNSQDTYMYLYTCFVYLYMYTIKLNPIFARSSRWYLCLYPSLTLPYHFVSTSPPPQNFTLLAYAKSWGRLQSYSRLFYCLKMVIAESIIPGRRLQISKHMHSFVFLTCRPLFFIAAIRIAYQRSASLLEWSCNYYICAFSLLPLTLFLLE